MNGVARRRERLEVTKHLAAAAAGFPFVRDVFPGAWRGVSARSIFRPRVPLSLSLSLSLSFSPRLRRRFGDGEEEVFFSPFFASKSQ